MSVVVENNQFIKISEEVGKVIQADINTSFRSCTFDRAGTRFQIVVTPISEENDRKKYVVAITNFFFSMTTEYPSKIGHKLTERGVMPAIDAESVEIAIKWLMAQ